VVLAAALLSFSPRRSARTTATTSASHPLERWPTGRTTARRTSSGQI